MLWFQKRSRYNCRWSSHTCANNDNENFTTAYMNNSELFTFKMIVQRILASMRSYRSYSGIANKLRSAGTRHPDWLSSKWYYDNQTLIEACVHCIPLLLDDLIISKELRRRTTTRIRFHIAWIYILCKIIKSDVYNLNRINGKYLFWSWYKIYAFSSYTWTLIMIAFILLDSIRVGCVISEETCVSWIIVPNIWHCAFDIRSG